MDQWRALPLTSNQPHPFIMAKWSFGEDRYYVKVTDLAHVWQESLQKDEIISRAHDLSCSIDPAEDATQLEYLLRKVELALTGDEETSVSLDHQDDGGNSISLSTTSTLPKPLKPLRWLLKLQRMPNDAVRPEAVLPLMSTAYIQQRQVEQLEHLLQEKDRAISKLVDKVESTGVTVATLFPVAGAARSGRKTASRETVFKQIRGLAPFDKTAWETQFDRTLDDAPSLKHVAESSFSARNAEAKHDLVEQLLSAHPAFSINPSSTQEGRSSQSTITMQGSQSAELQGPSSKPVRGRQLALGDRKHEDTLGNTEPISHRQRDEDETTDDEEETNPAHSKLIAKDDTDRSNWKDLVESPSPETSPQQGQKPQPKRKLGVIGGAKASNNEPKPIPSEPALLVEEPTTRGSTTRPAEGSPKQKAASRKLGLIGGRKPAVDSKTASTSGNASTADHGSRAVSTNTKSVKTDEATNLQEDPGPRRDDPGKTAAIASTSPLIATEDEEDVKQKADRKREELKHGLERNKTMPKKKRRF